MTLTGTEVEHWTQERFALDFWFQDQADERIAQIDAKDSADLETWIDDCETFRRICERIALRNTGKPLTIL